MSKRPNRLLVTLTISEAENAVYLIRTRSADFIMAHTIDAAYMAAFVPSAQKNLDTKGGSIHEIVRMNNLGRLESIRKVYTLY
jgi:phosphoserine aminotransferase